MVDQPSTIQQQQQQQPEVEKEEERIQLTVNNNTTTTTTTPVVPNRTPKYNNDNDTGTTYSSNYNSTTSRLQSDLNSTIILQHPLTEASSSSSISSINNSKRLKMDHNSTLTYQANDDGETLVPTPALAQQRQKEKEEEKVLLVPAVKILPAEKNDDEITCTSFPFLPLRQLRLEAIFYPKFENEAASAAGGGNNNNGDKSSIRTQMMDRCCNNNNNSHQRGYIEVSIKHSGSLVLWSGAQRYYSKNSVQNTFTYVCEILLRQHYYRIAKCLQQQEGTMQNNENEIQQHAEQLYNDCSQYIEQHRLTLSFEVVTSVLGDHGAQPHHDYIILTAIADRNRIAAFPQQQQQSTNTKKNHIFYTTMEIIQFAQKFHLPHNDYWIYNNQSSIEQLFHLYDTRREDGTTSTILPALSNAAMFNTNNDFGIDPVDDTDTINSCNDHYVQSMYPHAIYQGEILEGIVIRYVSSGSSNNIQQIKELARSSRTILQRFTSSTTTTVMSTATIQNEHDPLNSADSNSVNTFNKFESQQLPTTIYTINIRQLFDNTYALYSKKGVDDFEKRLRDILINNSISTTATVTTSELMPRPIVSRLIADPELNVKISKQVPIWIESLLQQKHQERAHSENSNNSNNKNGTVPLDVETQRIAKLIQDVSNISKNVTYNIFNERCDHSHDNTDGPNDDVLPSPLPSMHRYVCIVHVLHDQIFHKYHKWKQPTDLPLFRGFSLELIGGHSSSSCGNNETATSKEADAPISTDDVNTSSITIELDHTTDSDDESLMLKMKFLPYMVRTFCCRNGLKVIRQADGLQAFINFTNNLMSKWGISESSKQIWRPFFEGWAQYAQPRLRVNNKAVHPSLLINGGIDSIPLSEYSYLRHLEHFQQLYQSGKYRSPVSRSKLQGLVVVVAPQIDVSARMADYIAERLGGAKRRNSISDINGATMEIACGPGQGIVCNTTFSNEYSAIRKHLLKDFENFISIVLLHCGDISSLASSENEKKEMTGYLKGWKSTRSARNIELPDKFDPGRADDDTTFQPSDELNKLISELELPVVADLRPGLLIFFPTIPGSGKSSIVSNIDKDIGGKLHNRTISIIEGDRLKAKFWPHIKKMRRQNFSGIHIADKNAPNSAAWCTVGSVCASTCAVAVPVIPDPYAFTTTEVKGYRRTDGTVDSSTVHVYPFSLSYLAVCMTRVMSRTAGSHIGQLDQSNDRLCMIVVKFYSFYRHLTAEKMKAAIANAVASTGAIVSLTPIEIPFFRNGNNNNGCLKLPGAVEDVLLEALRCQFGYEKDKNDTTSHKQGSDTEEYLNDLESRLRSTLNEHRTNILDMTENLDFTRQQFAKSLIDKIKDVDLIASYDAPSFIKIASIDVDFASVLDLLKSIQCSSELTNTLDQILRGESLDNITTNSNDYDTVEGLGFVTRTHVTLAHYQEMSQSEIRSKFTPFIDASVEVVVHALLWNDRIMAFAVNVSDMTSDGTVLPPSKNEFVHMTIWHDTGVPAYESNSLPMLVDENKANRILFPEYVLRGTISLWDL